MAPMKWVFAIFLLAGCTQPTYPTSNRCAGPAPAPDAQCVEDCGPPVAREGDPPPQYHWLSADEASRRAQFGCPICMAEGSLVETPGGVVAISNLKVGEAVWSRDHRGARVEASVIHVGSTPVPATHTVQHVELEDGRTWEGSLGHPLGDGRAFGSLRAGELIEGVAIRSSTPVFYRGERTWDLVVDSDTGGYFVSGVFVRSTLDPR